MRVITFGDRLKQARKAANLKQADVAAMLDCAPTSLTNWENNKVQPSISVLSKLCEVYAISPFMLLGKNYDYADIVAIAGKPVSERSYEEQIALNFSASILKRVLRIYESRQDAIRAEELKAFRNQTQLRDRFGGSLSEQEEQEIKVEYEENGDVDGDILFAYHMLKTESKAAFLAMLCGLLTESDNVIPFNDSMAFATASAIDKLSRFRFEIRHREAQKRDNYL